MAVAAFLAASTVDFALSPASLALVSTLAFTSLASVFDLAATSFALAVTSFTLASAFL
ncbi:hypothetical protein [Mucilaginibacter antarcticus]|uniref:hypothetical protein n=1 Tax=Mucilaginibacter antarcticus TaxID=1855725 RepID=UPI00363CC265